MNPEYQILYLKARLSACWFWQRTAKKRLKKRIENLERKE